MRVTEKMLRGSQSLTICKGAKTYLSKEERAARATNPQRYLRSIIQLDYINYSVVLILRTPYYVLVRSKWKVEAEKRR